MTSTLPSRFYRISGSDISYDAESYRRYVQMIRDVKKDLDKLPLKTRRDVSLLIERAIYGAIKASEEIYSPLIDEQKMREVRASSNDFHTDLVGLDLLSDIFR